MSTEKKLVPTVPPPYQIHKCSVITDTHYVAEFAPVMRPTIESIIQKANSHAALVAALKGMVAHEEMLREIKRSRRPDPECLISARAALALENNAVKE